MAPYPVVLDVARVRAVVVGGGRVATRKVEGIVEAGGGVLVVAPAATPRISGLAEDGRIRWERRSYRSGDLAGAGLVFAATGRGEVNARVAREAGERGILVSVADDPAASSLHLPAVLRHQELVVAVSTGGASPVLARLVRDRIGARAVPPGVGRLARRLAALRQEVRRRWPDDEARRRELWRRLVTPELVQAAADEREEDVEQRVQRCLSES